MQKFFEYDIISVGMLWDNFEIEFLIFNEGREYCLMPDIMINEIKVAEAMSRDFGCVNQHTPIEQVIELMLQNHWDEVMVVNANGDFLGLVTKEHLVRKVSSGVSQEKPIIEICRRDVIYTHEQEALVEARDIMRRHKIGRLPVLDSSGQVIGILTARDVCNGFSSKLEMLGEHMYAVMENIAEAIQVIDCDGTVNFWNNSAERLFGIKAKDIIGRNLAEFFPNDIMLKVIETLESYSNVLCELQEGVFAVRNAVPVITPSGDIIGVVCTTLDVSHEKALMEKLDQANTRVKALERRIGCKEDAGELLFYTVNLETKRILVQARRVGRTDATVLVQGESGTGKELMANVVYRNSKRSQGPFIAVNCSAIPETLFESEMFGYESGAFTGGNRSGKPGKFEVANGGTLFLDEIGELPIEMQAKLLRVIQERKFYRVGGTTPIEVNVRLIAATNQDLSRLVKENKFREDLYYRLNVVTLEIPPLRQRKEDIPGLVNRFISEMECLYERRIKGVDQEVLDLFAEYDWPGNVRQLRNLLESVIILMEDDYISVDSLSEAGVLELLVSDTKSASGDNSSEGLVLADKNLDDLINKQEREVIIKALEDCRYNKVKAAKMLGIPRSTLYYKIKSLGISS